MFSSFSFFNTILNGLKHKTSKCCRTWKLCYNNVIIYNPKCCGLTLSFLVWHVTHSNLELRYPTHNWPFKKCIWIWMKWPMPYFTIPCMSLINNSWCSYHVVKCHIRICRVACRNPLIALSTQFIFNDSFNLNGEL
jgi:hypothetical protein